MTVGLSKTIAIKNNYKNMKNLNYKNFTYRLNEKTVVKIKDFKEQLNITYNLLFLDMLHQFNPKKYERPKRPKKMSDL